jgi:hypothetical protein
VGSKYTGLQTVFAVGVVAVVAMLLARRRGVEAPPFKSLIVLCGIALLIGAPWYAKNVAWVGNPVYPFFYGKLGGKNWSDWQARIYSDEQQSFGVARETPEGGIKPQRIGHAILGLAYQPGRYVNPGQAAGAGFPIGSVGFAVVGTLLIWLISGRGSPFENAVLGVVLMSFAMWFVLSEQSRYIVALGVPLTVMAGGAVVRLRAGPVLAGAIIVQALMSFYADKALRLDQQLPVVAGKVSRQEYLEQSVGFAKPAEYLNQVAREGKVALYDEVFGYLLDVPYFWANPGHTSELGYADMETGADLADRLKSLGFTHVYVNLLPPGTNREDPDIQAWLASMGLQGPPVPFPPERRAELMKDLNWRAKILLAEAIAAGRFVPVQSFGPRLILEVR